MSEYICFLITVLYESQGTLLKCAIKVKHKEISEDMCRFRLEPENRAKFHAMLPLHVRSCGPVVDVQEIFEIHEVRE